MDLNFNLNITDWVIVGIILLSLLFSLLKGFIKECLSLINWFLAFTIAKFLYESLAQTETFAKLPENVRIPVAIIVLFFVSFICGAILVDLVVRILRKTSGSINMTDRMLGMFFGAIRGVMIVCLFLAVCKMAFSLGLFAFVQKMPLWAESLLIPEFDRIVVWFFDKIDVANVMNNVTETLVNPLGGSESAVPAEVPASDAVVQTTEPEVPVEEVRLE